MPIKPIKAGVPTQDAIGDFQGHSPTDWQSGQVARFGGSDGLLRWAARLNGRGTAVGGDLGTGTGNP